MPLLACLAVPETEGTLLDKPAVAPNAVNDFGSRIRQNLEVFRRMGQSLATSATSFALFLRVKIVHGVAPYTQPQNLPVAVDSS